MLKATFKCTVYYTSYGSIFQMEEPELKESKYKVWFYRCLLQASELVSFFLPSFLSVHEQGRSRGRWRWGISSRLPTAHETQRWASSPDPEIMI